MSAVFGDLRLPERFWSKVEPEPNSGCWLWTAACYENGYGAFKFDGRTRLVHRISYMALIGVISPGLQVDHLCRVRCCVNPAHMEPVTSRVNLLRGVGFSAVNSQKTVAACGHPFNSSRYEKGRIRCRICSVCFQKRKAEYMQMWYKNNRSIGGGPSVDRSR